MKRYSEKERRALVGDYERSGMSAAAFCRQAGITAVTLAHWRRRLSRRSPKHAKETPAPQWVPVVVDHGGEMASCYVLTDDSVRLEVPRGYDFKEVAALWRMMAEVKAQEVCS